MNTFRSTPNTTTGQQVNPAQVLVLPQDTSHNAHPESCMHVHQPISQVCKPGELLTLRKVKHPLNGRTSVSRLPLTKQDILSQYSSCFEGIGCFPGDPYKFHLKPDYKLARQAPRKFPVHLETAFKEEIESLVKQGILEEVKEHTDWVNSYVIVEKDTGNHHSSNHTVKKKLRICLDPRDLNEALDRETYHTRSVGEITAKLQGTTVFTIANFKTHSTREITAKFLSRNWNMPDISQHTWKCAWTTTSLLLQRRSNKSSFKTKPMSKAVQHTAFHQTHRRTLFAAMQNFHQTWKAYQFS